MSVFFITGTDTDVGKTYVTCALIRHFQQQSKRVLALKPISSGGVYQDNKLVSADILAYEAALNTPAVHSPWCFALPIAPHLAAKVENITLSAKEIYAWCIKQINLHRSDITLIEGAGGLLVPLNSQQTWIDVIHALSVPVIIVVGIRLGCINHALLTESALYHSSCQIAGWVANHTDNTNDYTLEIIESLQSRMRAPYLGEVPYQKTLKHFEIETISAKLKYHKLHVE